MVALLGQCKNCFVCAILSEHQVAQELFCEDRPVIKKEMRAKIFEIHCSQ